jgi:hypothetical protein
VKKIHRHPLLPTKMGQYVAQCPSGIFNSRHFPMLGHSILPHIPPSIPLSLFVHNIPREFTFTGILKASASSIPFPLSSFCGIFPLSLLWRVAWGRNLRLKLKLLGYLLPQSNAKMMGRNGMKMNLEFEWKLMVQNVCSLLSATVQKFINSIKIF